MGASHSGPALKLPSRGSNPRSAYFDASKFSGFGCRLVVSEIRLGKEQNNCQTAKTPTETVIATDVR